MRSLKLNKWLQHIGYSIYPWQCMVCGCTSDQNVGICTSCYQLLPWCQSACTICGLPIINTEIGPLVCGRCQTQQPYYDHLHAVLWYQPPIDRLIVDFKYTNKWQNARLLVDLISSVPHYHWKDALLLPVPSHPARVRERGFNAVFELIRLLSRYINIKYDLHCIRRNLHTPTQTGRTRQQRRKNVRNAFDIIKSINREYVILFDDVVTTGATVNELSKRLKKAGVSRVDVWAIARTKSVSNNSPLFQ